MNLSVNPENPELATSLVKKHPQEVIKLCRRIFSQSSDCEDICQDFFIYLLDTALSNYKNQYKLSTFITACARQFYLNYRMTIARKNRQRNKFAPSNNGECSVMELVQKREIAPEHRTIINETLASLPFTTRRLVEGYYLENTEVGDLARELGITEKRAYLTLGKWKNGQKKMANR